MCDCGKNCNIPVGPPGPQGPQGIQGPQGEQGIQGEKGEDATDPSIDWKDFNIIGNWSAGSDTPQYAVDSVKGLVYFRGSVYNGTPSVSLFTDTNIGMTSSVITTVGDQRSVLPSTAIFLEKILIGPGGINPLNNNVHYLYLDSIPPISLR